MACAFLLALGLSLFMHESAQILYIHIESRKTEIKCKQRSIIQVVSRSRHSLLPQEVEAQKRRVLSSNEIDRYDQLAETIYRITRCITELMQKEIRLEFLACKEIT